MTPESNASSEYQDVTFVSTGVDLIEVSDSDGTLVVTPPQPMNASELLRLMRERVRLYGTPLPERFAAPPGIDVAELLKQVPWPPKE